MAKTARKKTAEELIKKSEKTWQDENLVKLAENPPLKKDGSANLTKVYETAFEYVLKNADLRKAKELAVATRWLAMYSQDYRDDFAKKWNSYWIDRNAKKKTATEKDNISKISEPKPEPKPEPKDVEIELIGDLIFCGRPAHPHEKYLRILKSDLLYSGLKMVANLLQLITNVEPLPEKGMQFPEIKTGFYMGYYPRYGEEDSERAKRLSALRNYFIQILEEKFGMTIKICGNCKYYSKSGSFTGGPGCARQGEDKILQNYSGINCKANGFKENLWAPKEIPPEKKEEEKTSANCGQRWHCFRIAIEPPKKCPCDKWTSEKVGGGFGDF